jgi:hypothetical protein
MPAFDAGAVVEALDWDFTAAGVKAKGTIPEPSDVLIGAFLDAVKKLYTKAKEDGLAPEIDTALAPEKMLEALSGITGDAYVEFMGNLAEIFAALCSDKPTKANLLALPMRVRVKFYAWVQEEVVSPEAGTGAGTVALRSVPQDRAG